MVRASELPPVEPQWYPRQMTAKEVVEIASGREVPGINLDHPVVEGIRLAGMGILTRDYFRDARVRGYLWLVSQRSDTGWHGPTEHIWGWWCAAAKHPEIVVTRRGEDCRLRVDLSSLQTTWHLHALPELGRLIADGAMGNGFLLSSDTFEIDGLDTEGSAALAQDILKLLGDRRMTVARQVRCSSGQRPGLR